MTIEKREEVIGLYDIYKPLLTDKQKKYFEDYYFEDLSIGEIAENYQISRNAVFDQIKRVTAILMDYEAKLSLDKKITSIENLDIEDIIKEKVLEIMKE